MNLISLVPGEQIDNSQKYQESIGNQPCKTDQDCENTTGCCSMGSCKLGYVCYLSHKPLNDTCSFTHQCKSHCCYQEICSETTKCYKKCKRNSDCETNCCSQGACNFLSCQGQKADGDSCDVDSECLSGQCNHKENTRQNKFYLLGQQTEQQQNYSNGFCMELKGQITFDNQTIFELLILLFATILISISTYCLCKPWSSIDNRTKVTRRVSQDSAGEHGSQSGQPNGAIRNFRTDDDKQSYNSRQRSNHSIGKRKVRRKIQDKKNINNGNSDSQASDTIQTFQSDMKSNNSYQINIKYEKGSDKISFQSLKVQSNNLAASELQCQFKDFKTTHSQLNYSIGYSQISESSGPSSYNQSISDSMKFQISKNEDNQIVSQQKQQFQIENPFSSESSDQKIKKINAKVKSNQNNQNVQIESDQKINNIKGSRPQNNRQDLREISPT